MTRRWALALVLAVSLLSHVKGLTAPPLDYHFHRQVNTAAIARNYAENGRHFFTPQIDWAGAYRGRAATEFPLYMWLTGVLWPAFGLGVTWGRLLSALFSALSALYLFLFLERRLSFAEAAAGACLFSLIPVEVYFGRTIQPEALALAATLAALYHWDAFLDAESPLHWAAAVLGAFLAIAHKLPYAYALLTLAFLAHARRGWAAFSRPLVLAAAPLCAAAVFAWYKFASTGAYVVPTNPSQFTALLNYKLFYVQFQLVSRLPELGATWAGMALAAPGAWLLWKRGDRFFHAWWASVALYIVAGGAYTFYHEYTSLPFAPVMAAFMGAGLVSAWRGAERLPGTAYRRALLAALVLAMPVMTVFRIKHWYIQNFPFLARAQAAADSVSKPDDLFLCNQRATSVYLYEMRRRGWSFGFADAGAEWTRQAQEAIAGGARFFATAAENYTPEQRAWFDARYPKVYDDGAFLIYKLEKKPVPAGPPIVRSPARPPATQPPVRFYLKGR